MDNGNIGLSIGVGVCFSFGVTGQREGAIFGLWTMRARPALPVPFRQASDMLLHERQFLLQAALPQRGHIAALETAIHYL